MTRWSSLVCLVVVLVLPSSLLAFTAEEIFKTYRSHIYQIKVVDIESDSRTSIGSGFVVADRNTVATNYHVISSFVAKPEKYKILIVPESGSAIPVKVVDFDIINDLALLQAQQPLTEPIVIAQQEPIQGAEIFSVGNPLDLGMTVVPGTYNGLADTAYYHRIHFSGSINPGMSGGPVFDNQGELVGINVATSGNQVSFLVPAEKLASFIAKREVVAPERMLHKAEKQLLESQTELVDNFLNKPRDLDNLGEAIVLGDIDGLVACWGRSSRDENKDSLIVEVTKGCSLADNIYISGRMTTGRLGYQFNWYDGRKLSSVQFSNYLQSHMDWRADNHVSFDDVTKYQCNEAFTQIGEEFAPDDIAKSFFCVRRYTKFPKLHDVVYFRVARRGPYALISHFTVSGVSQSASLSFLESFVGSVTWPQ